jgi:hypothetical protein
VALTGHTQILVEVGLYKGTWVSIQKSQQVPVAVVGSSKFGLYSKINDERTYNMFISDEWLVNYAGFQKVANTLDNVQGRGLFHSIRGNFAIAVIGSAVYRFGPNVSPLFLSNIDTTSGEVFMDENLSQQICIVDGEDAYIYDYFDTGQVTKQTLGFAPGYVSYQNTFFLIASAPNAINPQKWYTFVFDTTTTIIKNTEHVLQTKPDSALAIKRLPGRGNHIIVFGSSVAEVWTNVGGEENYRRNSSFNIDNGAVSINTIAASEDVVCWLGQNENNSPALMVTDGSQTKRISTDGIDGLLQRIKRPDKSTAFFYRQDGHLFYQITFFDDQDNLTLIHDFNTGLFFHVTDEHMHYFPARQVIYFNKRTYFVSINDGHIYEMGTDFISYNYDTDTSLQGETIPRVRVCNTIRVEDNSIFRVGRFTFWLDQGTSAFPYLSTETAKIDMSFSKNGNHTYSNIVSRELNPQGKFRNRLDWNRMGHANEFTIQLRFWGLNKIVAKQGVVEVY